MKVSLHHPSHPLLKEYIKYFYFLDRSAEDKEITYLGFPTSDVYIMILSGGDCKISGEDMEIEGTENSGAKAFLFVDDKKSGYMKYNGAIREITICFRPLGINPFLECDFSDYVHSQISPFNPYADFREQMDLVFSESSEPDMLNAIERYLLSKLRHFQHQFIHNIVRDIIDGQASAHSVSAIAQKYDISRPTLNKHFKKHLGTNPNQFIRIVRFRKAMKKFSSKSSEENLVDVAFLTQYFDQSHMIKDFISLTGYTPKVFFSKLTQLENGQINWLFL